MRQAVLLQQRGMVPDLIRHGALLSACKKGKHPEQPLRVFHAMQQRGMVPNIITYIVLISACVMRKQPVRALERFLATQGEGWVQSRRERFTDGVA